MCSTPTGRAYDTPAVNWLVTGPCAVSCSNGPVVCGTTTYHMPCRCQPVSPPGGKRHSVTLTCSLSIWTVEMAAGRLTGVILLEVMRAGLPP